MQFTFIKSIKIDTCVKARFRIDTKRKFVYNKSVNRYKRTYVIFLDLASNFI